MEDCGVGKGFSLRLIEVPGYGVMAALADLEELGRVEEDRERGLRLEVSPAFYSGRVVCGEEARRILSMATILVLAGRRIIGMAVEMGLVNPDSILEVNGLPHVQVYKFRF
ncbi:MAG: DUF424 family protein [Desulfurococcales archaeon]|nr:DUF424 family protein [Desulfurococcales archaeon]